MEKEEESEKAEDVEKGQTRMIEITLKEVIQPRREKAMPMEFPDLPYIGLEHVEAHTMQLIGYSRSGGMVSTANRFYQGDVLYSRLRPYLNKVTEAGFDGLCSSEFIVFPPSKCLNSSFLKYHLNSAYFVAFASSLNAGDRPSVDFNQISSFKFLLPSSLHQARIVTKLEELLSDLDAGVAELKAAQKKLTQYRQSLLKAALEGALTAEWRAERAKRGELLETGAQLLERILAERCRRWEEKQLARFKEQGKTPPKDWRDKYPEPVKPNTADLPELPEGWVWASVDQLSSFITSGSRGWADYYSRSGALFIRSQDINTDRLDLSEIAHVELPALIEGARTRIEYNDVLLTITGANVGKCAHVDVRLDESYVSQHVALIRPTNGFLGAYLHLYLTCLSGGRGQLNKLAYGAGKPGLNLQQVASVVLPFTSEDEIKQILIQISSAIVSIDQQMKSIEFAMKQSSAQRQNILKAAFSGQLVPQDPNDEPASVLLERIRAERAARESGGRWRGRKAREGAA